ncbi:MAG: hypothetical protein IH851_04490 [Armatimonadetes bacterium]|nr:hypothetical protein [Armatimonadota bacterium]
MFTVVALAVFLAAPPIELTIHSSDSVIGSARITQKLTESGGLKVEIRMQLVAGDVKITVVQEGEYDSDARPVRKTSRQSGGGPELIVRATFLGRTATVVTERGRERETRTVTAPAGAEIRLASEFWFIKTKPEPGTKLTAYRFDLTKLEWVKTTVTYVRSEKVNAGGKTYTGHLILMDDAKSWVDDKGAPIRIEMRGIRFERKP